MYRGIALEPVGDRFGDARTDWAIAQITADSDAGAVELYGFDPFLYTDREQLSIASGESVNFEIDFPATEAGQAYIMLTSAAGTGPTNVSGLDIPLTNDVFMSRMLTGWVPNVLVDGGGTLNVDGDATAVFHQGFGLSRRIGTTFHWAVVSYEAATRTPRLSSAACPVEVVP